MVGTIIFVLGIPSALSFGVLSEFQFFGNNFFDNANYLVSNIMLPLGALMIALFIHFKIPRKELAREFTNNTSKRMRLFVSWLLVIKYIAPIAIIRSEEHTSELQSRFDLVCRLLLKKKNNRSSSSLRHLYHISDTCTYSISGNEMR